MSGKTFINLRKNQSSISAAEKVSKTVNNLLAINHMPRIALVHLVACNSMFWIYHQLSIMLPSWLTCLALIYSWSFAKTAVHLSEERERREIRSLMTFQRFFSVLEKTETRFIYFPGDFSVDFAVILDKCTYLAWLQWMWLEIQLSPWTNRTVA